MITSHSKMSDVPQHFFPMLKAPQAATLKTVLPPHLHNPANNIASNPSIPLHLYLPSGKSSRKSCIQNYSSLHPLTLFQFPPKITLLRISLAAHRFKTILKPHTRKDIRLQPLFLSPVSSCRINPLLNDLGLWQHAARFAIYLWQFSLPADAVQKIQKKNVWPWELIV